MHWAGLRTDPHIAADLMYPSHWEQFVPEVALMSPEQTAATRLHTVVEHLRIFKGVGSGTVHSCPGKRAFLVIASWSERYFKSRSLTLENERLVLGPSGDFDRGQSYTDCQPDRKRAHSCPVASALAPFTHTHIYMHTRISLYRDLWFHKCVAAEEVVGTNFQWSAWAGREREREGHRKGGWWWGGMKGWWDGSPRSDCAHLLIDAR